MISNIGLEAPTSLTSASPKKEISNGSRHRNVSSSRDEQNHEVQLQRGGRAVCGQKGGPRTRIKYRRFATAAEAIRFAVEGLPPIKPLGAWIQVGNDRFSRDEIRRLYDHSDYPFRRLFAPN
jgi:hypothetical protein